MSAHRTVEREQYRLDLNITTDGHFITFQHDDVLLSEVSSGAHHPLPSNGILLSQPVQGNRVDDLLYREKVLYRSSVHLESVNPKTFVTIQQQLDHKLECEGLIHRFDSNGRIAFGALSYINVQAFRKHVKVRTFHTFPDTNAVLKSETTFTLSQ